MKHEAKYNTDLNRYLRDKKMYCFYELKYTGNVDSFQFAKIRKVQWDGAIATKKTDWYGNFLMR